MRRTSFLPLAATVLASFAAPPTSLLASALGSQPDRERAHFARCSGQGRVTCVVDGDTIWYRGTKLRIADINAPELSKPQCAYEAQLAEAATQRLTGLLNQGPFTLAATEREIDRYGRTLRVVTRGGQSLGATLAGEGLAEPWRGHRRNWC
ncbi:MAG: thermonuclease family protein [Novosphingobium sp.]